MKTKRLDVENSTLLFCLIELNQQLLEHHQWLKLSVYRCEEDCIAFVFVLIYYIQTHLWSFHHYICLIKDNSNMCNMTPWWWNNWKWSLAPSRTEDYFTFTWKLGSSLSGSARQEKRLIPAARNYKRVLSRLVFCGNGAAGDYRCESQITVLALLSLGLGNCSLSTKKLGEISYSTTETLNPQILLHTVTL